MNPPIDFFLKNAEKRNALVRVTFGNDGPRPDALILDPVGRVAILLRDCGGDAVNRGRPAAGSLVHYKLEKDSAGAHYVDGEAWTSPNRWMADFTY